jgi:phosphoribosylanthranilate isomerase
VTLAKVCGLTTRETVDAALDAGAAYLGFVFFPGSPRALTLETAVPLFRRTRGRAQIVALLADPTHDLLDDVVCTLDPDMIQLHGRESPDRIAAIKEDYDLPVIKALGVRQGADLDAASAYERVADHLMLDAKPPDGAGRTGGHGVVFDWSLLQGRTPTKPWFLAGGLTPDNVAEAIRATGAPMVDVSSGVESAPGVKDPALIAAFLQAVRSA